MAATRILKFRGWRFYDVDGIDLDSFGDPLFAVSALVSEPLTNGDIADPELVFAGGDVIMA
jgi:hypothetical protein